MRESLVYRLEEITVTASLAVASLLAFVNVVLRYVFNRSWAWGEDAVIVLIIWSVFVGAAIAVRRRQHIRVEVVVDLLPESWQHRIRLFTDVLCLGYSLFVLYYGIRYDVFLYKIWAVPVATLNIPEFLLFLCVPLGGLLLSIRYFQEMWTRFRGGAPLEQK